ncbi:MAG: hypothetical protein V3T31_10135, partial [candidate division Zixibacteria bacterium]
SAGFCLLFFTSLTFAADRKQASLERIGEIPVQSLGSGNVGLATADTCIARLGDSIYYRIDGWVTGGELYKAYIDPSNTCPNPYPFTVTAINMPMMFSAPTPLVVSVDVETVDLSVPDCPFPGEPIVISSDWEFQVPGEGLYDIWIPLDSPVTVTGPFFAGFFISNQFDPIVNAAVVTDTFPVSCASYNVWDATIGYVDMTDNQFYNFPGRLTLYAAGIPGGQSGEPIPELSWCYPSEDDPVLYPPAELWSVEQSGSSIVSYVVYEYSSDGSSFQSIGIALDGGSPVRNGVHSTPPGGGYSVVWDFSMLAEGDYTIRATAVDTLGRETAISRTITLEPTPPVPEIVSPSDFDQFCSEVNFLMQSNDEDLSFVEVKALAKPDNHVVGVGALNQQLLGDNDGDINDGNSASQGEFGDYYSGPAAAALSLQYWYNRGWPNVMASEAGTMNIATAAESLAVIFDTRNRLGTGDDYMYHALSDFCRIRNNEMALDYVRYPGYPTMRIWSQDEQRTLILGLGGQPSSWVLLAGFKGWMTGVDSITVSISNPMTGTIEDLLWRKGISGSELLIGIEWHPVEIMISMVPRSLTISRAMLGVDINGNDGWSVTWLPANLAEGDYFYMRAQAKDATQFEGNSVIIMQYQCSSVYAPGDLNDDGAADVADLYYLIQFILLGGPAPTG